MPDETRALTPFERTSARIDAIKAAQEHRRRNPQIPADRDRYPPGCPDGDYCRGNRMCFWRCTGGDDDGL